MPSPQLCSSSTWWTPANFLSPIRHQGNLRFCVSFEKWTTWISKFQSSLQSFFEHTLGSLSSNWQFCSNLRKQPTFSETTTGLPTKWQLRNDWRNSILMMCYYANMGSASDWLKEISLGSQPFKRTTQIWVVTCHQHGISVQIAQTSFHKETRGRMANCQLISPANFVGNCS